MDLNVITAEISVYQGNIWTHITSLKQGDTTQLGYDSAKAWRTLPQANHHEIIAAMNAPPNRFRWYAAFHDEGEHPHIHVMTQSTQPGETYPTRDGIHRIKSVLADQIFQQEMPRAYEQKPVLRDELIRQMRRIMARFTRKAAGGVCNCLEAEVLVRELAIQLETVKDKKPYGCLPKPVGRTAGEIVDELEKLSIVKQCYEQWLVLQNQVDSYYHDSPRERKELSQEKGFRAIKNAVIRKAERIRLGEPTSEDQGMERIDEQPDDHRMSFKCREPWRFILDERQPLGLRDQGVERLEWLAEQRGTHARFVMGRFYRGGPLPVPDNQEAKRWFTLAAERGMSEAQYALGKLFLSKDPEAHNPEEGSRWLRRAMQEGSTYAAYRLGKEYLMGGHASRSGENAMRCFRSSAEQDNPLVQYMLDELYLDGEAPPRD